jgi:hypothetical protein
MLPSGEIPMPYSTALVKSNRFLVINTIFLTLELRVHYKFDFKRFGNCQGVDHVPS